MSSSSLPIFLNPRIYIKPQNLFASTFPSFTKSLTSKSLLCFASDSSQFERQESFWVREEQRWIREEQRWLREEQRWARERDSLLRRIAELEIQIQALQQQKSVQAGAEVSETIASIAGLLQILKEKNRIAENGSSSTPMVLEESKIPEEEKEVVVVERVVRVSEEAKEKEKKKKRSTLRIGSEGEEVQAMQEALGKLGFYSGEEEIEFSSFSTGTERAVKTWQSTFGAPEDGIMTEELLERLYEEIIQGPLESNIYALPKEGENGAPVSSVTEVSNIQQTVVKEEGISKAGLSKHRVFLLGENRWEDSSRLVGINKKGDESKTKEATTTTTTKCLTCRGEGRLLCLECDGTGEPNIEPQFLEWVGEEDAKCPYCDGLGYSICDVCDGKTVV
ncbi:protein disulfide isomerase pTAC5, chloroplastic [Cannabis sativa]|uniref:protein disulfide isomerase pTAC5, chloroplastic n=1 Tax=Cannabis sativa TaxID=3483 RepID=UPI0029CA9BC5|nr:protein disulfide isomerase pTAC5, chloroplastic [Cannabis sativa]XP_060959908.1 protein disulfide isomerase pTAC5, chloroplastic [Cannabis sativa]